MKSATENEYGFCQDGKVFIRPYLNFPQREIGFVRETEEASLAYFVKRFELANNKVNILAREVTTVQNKGSFLSKVVQMKAYLGNFDGLGDFIPLFDQLDQMESYLRGLIQNNQIKNLEIKRALIQDAAQLAEQEDILKATEDLLDTKVQSSP